MNILELIQTRRTIHEFKETPVPKEVIEQLLTAATWAPNHKMTEPWEFYVASGATKEQLARLRGELKRAKQADPTSAVAEKVYQKAYTELATVPWVILVAQVLNPKDPHREQEDFLAVGCAIQNIQLAAHALGLGTFWGTGALLDHPETFRLLGVPEGRRAVGLIFVGEPAHPTRAPERTPAREKTRWFE